MTEESEVYYDNGQLLSKGNWKNGKKEGTWVWHNKDGSKSTYGKRV